MRYESWEQAITSKEVQNLASTCGPYGEIVSVGLGIAGLFVDSEDKTGKALKEIKDQIYGLSQQITGLQTTIEADLKDAVRAILADNKQIDWDNKRIDYNFHVGAVSRRISDIARDYVTEEDMAIHFNFLTDHFDSLKNCVDEEVKQGHVTRTPYVFTCGTLFIAAATTVAGKHRKLILEDFVRPMVAHVEAMIEGTEAHMRSVEADVRQRYAVNWFEHVEDVVETYVRKGMPDQRLVSTTETKEKTWTYYVDWAPADGKEDVNRFTFERVRYTRYPDRDDIKPEKPTKPVKYDSATAEAKARAAMSPLLDASLGAALQNPRAALTALQNAKNDWSHKIDALERVPFNPGAAQPGSNARGRQ